MEFERTKKRKELDRNRIEEYMVQTWIKKQNIQSK
jgi:hypothetical protein